MADSDIPVQFLTFKYRLRLRKNQHEALEGVLEGQRQLYNAAIEERFDSYRKTGKSPNYYAQCRSLTAIRQDADFSKIPTNIQRWTLGAVQKAYEAFFRSMSHDQRGGYPKFKGFREWTTFGFAEWNGIRFSGGGVRVKSVEGTIRMRSGLQRPTGNPASCTLTKDLKGWVIGLQYAVPTTPQREAINLIGIDLGIAALATLSNGVRIENIKPLRRRRAELRRRERALARCRKGSKLRQKRRMALRKAHANVRNRRETYLHQVATSLCVSHDLLAIERLTIKALSMSFLAREVNDAAWGKLVTYLRYKSKKLGCGLVEVDPAFTSQTCPQCGAIKKKDLSERVHSCSCGCVLDRDVAAARVILQRAVLGPQALNVADCGERAPRTTAMRVSTTAIKMGRSNTIGVANGARAKEKA